MNKDKRIIAKQKELIEHLKCGYEPANNNDQVKQWRIEFNKL